MSIKIALKIVFFQLRKGKGRKVVLLVKNILLIH